MGEKKTSSLNESTAADGSLCAAQIAYADRLVLNKADLVPDNATLEALIATVQQVVRANVVVFF